jgi:uncharacterized protein YecE (DUF72 family)
MIRVGTCSWTEKTLLKSGEFYPAGARTAEDRLRHYAAFFDTVEVDSSYYAIPHPGNASVWPERTPDDFIFHVKAFGAMTGHAVDPKTLPPEVFRSLPDGERDKKQIYIRDAELLKTIGRRFADSLVPLRNAGKLGVIVFQFPPWFHYRSEHLDRIADYTSLVAGLPAAVEFRHGSWLSPGKARMIFDYLKKRRIAYVTADEPQYGSLATVPFVPEATADIAYFRFHGRNRENWLKKGIETSLRYDYLYSDEELSGFVPPLLAAEKKVSVVYAMFNNCHGASAVKNARRLKELLEERKTGVIRRATSNE